MQPLWMHSLLMQALWVHSVWVQALRMHFLVCLHALCRQRWQQQQAWVVHRGSVCVITTTGAVHADALQGKAHIYAHLACMHTTICLLQHSMVVAAALNMCTCIRVAPRHISCTPRCFFTSI